MIGLVPSRDPYTQKGRLDVQNRCVLPIFGLFSCQIDRSLAFPPLLCSSSGTSNHSANDRTPKKIKKNSEAVSMRPPRVCVFLCACFQPSYTVATSYPFCDR